MDHIKQIILKGRRSKSFNNNCKNLNNINILNITPDQKNKNKHSPLRNLFVKNPGYTKNLNNTEYNNTNIYSNNENIDLNLNNNLLPYKNLDFYNNYNDENISYEKKLNSGNLKNNNYNKNKNKSFSLTENFQNKKIQNNFLDNFYNDKENTPPIPKESSKFSNLLQSHGQEMQNLCPLEINIELGISHINSEENSKRTIEVPILIDCKPSNISSSHINLVKDFVIIFNTLNISISEIFVFLNNLNNNLTYDDRVFSNIFLEDTWLKKENIENILKNINNNSQILKDIVLIDNSGILKVVNYCVDISLEYNSNIFSVVIITDVHDIYNNYNYFEEYKLISQKLNEKRVLMVKNFTINSIILEKNSENFDENYENLYLKSMNFFYDLCNLTMGMTYFVKVNFFDNIFRLGFARISEICRVFIYYF